MILSSILCLSVTWAKLIYNFKRNKKILLFEVLRWGHYGLSKLEQNQKLSKRNYMTDHELLKMKFFRLRAWHLGIKQYSFL
jgi:hypothetical protein